MLQHLDRMASAGYDDVDDFANLSVADLEACAAELKALGMPPGHAGKIIRAMSAPVAPTTPAAAGQKRPAEPVPADLQHLVAGPAEGAAEEGASEGASEGAAGGATVDWGISDAYKPNPNQPQQKQPRVGMTSAEAAAARAGGAPARAAARVAAAAVLPNAVAAAAPSPAAALTAAHAAVATEPAAAAPRVAATPSAAAAALAARLVLQVHWVQAFIRPQL